MVPVEDEPRVRLSGAAVSVAVDGGGTVAAGRTGACDEATGRVAATARASVLVVPLGTGDGDERTLAGRLTLTGTATSAPPPSGADAEADGAGAAIVGPLARMAAGMPLKPRTANSVVTPRAHAPATIARRPDIRRRRADGASRRPGPAGRRARLGRGRFAGRAFPHRGRSDRRRGDLGRHSGGLAPPVSPR